MNRFKVLAMTKPLPSASCIQIMVKDEDGVLRDLRPDQIVVTIHEKEDEPSPKAQ